ncbi:MAG: glycosyltransferase [Bacteroidia bacterium]
MLKQVIISVTSDLVTDQRVHRTASTLKESGYKILVIGRRLPSSAELAGKKYRCKRFQLWFHKGPLFYASYNLRLFWFLLFSKAEILLSNDLDTLPANYLISKLKRIPLVYDSHEYFTGVPELVNRPRVQRIWKKIEARILPHLQYAYTVNDSIARLYREEYGVEFLSIRNVPEPRRYAKRDKALLRRELKLPTDKRIILLQGAGINIQRGAEEAVEAMQYLENYLLLIVGGGDVLPVLKKIVAEYKLGDKVRFEGKKPPSELVFYTESADLGLSLDKDTNLNYRYSLPNKLFDYIHAGIPVLVSDLPEVRAIVDQYNIGSIATSHDPRYLAGKIEEMFQHPEMMEQMTRNLEAAARELNWETERKKLTDLFKNIG